jgi:hypothetical protein
MTRTAAREATLPSRIASTCSCALMLSIGSFLPLKANDEVRAATRKPDTLESAVIKSSVMPSLKYSFSLSELMLTNGNTAIDFFAAVDTAADCGAPGLCGARTVHHHISSTPANADESWPWRASRIAARSTRSSSIGATDRHRPYRIAPTGRDLPALGRGARGVRRVNQLDRAPARSSSARTTSAVQPV